jgi:hypothetical protein
MKTRHGFVSNSSSSSFLVAYKAYEKCLTCNCTRPDFGVQAELISRTHDAECFCGDDFRLQLFCNFEAMVEDEDEAPWLLKSYPVPEIYQTGWKFCFVSAEHGCYILPEIMNLVDEKDAVVVCKCTE